MSWYIVKNGSGEAVSMGTVLANPMPSGLAAVALSDADASGILAGEKRWDAATQTVVAVTQPVPESVTRWQLRTWLLRSLGVNPAAVSSLIGGIQDAATRAQAQIDWDDAPIVRRGHPLIDTLGGALGLTAAQIDQGFREAAALEQ
jgi:hypothetical protein